ncbi:MAG TPA: hypothetical protein VFO70_09880, partial [Chitinophagaceae bacterium]|nr:hypothetical protein [Chitinophagaceae bacterium]
MRRSLFIFTFSLYALSYSSAQEIYDSLLTQRELPTDTVLRITNLNPYFTLHVDSLLSYQLSINKAEKNYYWYIKNSPVGLKINKDNGLLSFKPEKSYFMSGKLKYDREYTVKLGVQNLADPTEKVDTGFTLVFYNTEIIMPKVKPTVSGTLVVEEGQLVSFNVLCEEGNFSIENILFTSNIPISNYSMVKHCEDRFEWTPPYEFVKETDPGKEKSLQLNFIGSSRFNAKDTAMVTIVVKDALNYPLARQEYDNVVSNLKNYVLRLKFTFLQLDKRLKKTKTVRTSFDLTSATTALTGTILSTTGSESSRNAGKILPSIGVALVPVKEATAPNKNVEQNQASLIRSSIKRLEYMIYDYMLVGDKDPGIATKTNKLKEELKQSQMQLIDVP